MSKTRGVPTEITPPILVDLSPSRPSYCNLRCCIKSGTSPILLEKKEKKTFLKLLIQKMADPQLQEMALAIIKKIHLVMTDIHSNSHGKIHHAIKFGKPNLFR